ncbi:hypothetical protein ACHAXR_008851 [Thalassiosira sp. AJA248-18]
MLQRTSPNNHNGRGGIIFESYEANNANNSNIATTGNIRTTTAVAATRSQPQRDFGNGSIGAGGAGGSSSSSHNRSPLPSILDNIMTEAARVDKNNNNNAALLANHVNNAGPQSSVVLSKKPMPSPSPSSAPLQPAEQSATLGVGRSSSKTGMVNKLVSLFANKHKEQNNNNNDFLQQGSSPSPTNTTTTGSSLQQKLKQTIQFHVPQKQQQSPSLNNNHHHHHHQGGTASSPPTTMTTNHNTNHPSSSNNNTTTTIPSILLYPALRSSNNTAQSIISTSGNVTVYSAGTTTGGGEDEDASSYNPTGWPGTVDKRGRTYMMEPSYSESEDGSNASPQKQQGRSSNARGVVVGVGSRLVGSQQQQQQQMKEGISPSKIRSMFQGDNTTNNYPVQNYRNEDAMSQQQQQQHQLQPPPPAAASVTEKRQFSFDGNSSAVRAELNEWLTGDVDDNKANDLEEDDNGYYDVDEVIHSHQNNGRSSGPIDLDSCYSSGNYQSHETKATATATATATGSVVVDLDEAYERRFDLPNNISETKTAADIQLEVALGMSTTFTNKRLTTLPNNKSSMGIGNAAGGGSRSFSYSSPPPPPNHSKLDKVVDEEEAKQLQGIDLSGSAQRVRASGKRLPSPKIYNEEVDFDSYNNSNNNINSSYSSPQRIIQQQSSTGLSTTLSEEALRWNNSISAPPRAGASMNFRGYIGFLDKTKDVPNLMDDLEGSSEASTSLGTGVGSSRQHNYAGNNNTNNMGLALPITTAARKSSMSNNHHRPSSLVSSSNGGFDSGSDVFDGIQEEQFGPMEKDILNVNSEQLQVGGVIAQQQQQQRPPRHSSMPPLKNQSVKQQQQEKQNAFANFDGENLPYSTQFNPFTNGHRGGTSRALLNTNDDARSSRPSQPHHQHFDTGTGNVDFFDPSLDISAVTKGSSADVHHLDEGDLEEIEDDFDDESFPDLSIYYVQPELVRKMVRAFRKICTGQMEISSNRSEETMLYDFENLVDTKKAFALFEMRSRIMETDIDRGLERRGGTNIVDDIVLTPHFQAAARVRDAVIVSKAWRDGATPKDVVTAHLLTRRSAKEYFVRRPIQRIVRPGQSYYNQFDMPQYWLEEVKWLDDTDFMLMRCQSLGFGTMKGFEMFTIGDCQSILLKMTSDNCTQLRRELRSAMLRQIEAEELMSDEIDLDGDENIVAEAEQLYRDATIEVKTLSVKLVLADKAFTLVRNRMEKLVETIESLLVQIENGDESDDDHTSSSTRSDDVDESDNGSYSSQESQDRDKLVARAKRAELSAEVAVREALLAKQEAEKIKSDKQREIDNLKEKLADMETKSQLLASEHRLGYMNGGNNSYLDKLEAKSFLESTFDRDREEAAARKERLKQKFRERQRSLSKPEEEEQPERNQNQLKDEEIYQHLDFYSRSLNAVSANKS